MTISLLAYDEETASYGGIAATGSLCVGGWVLRGDAESGMSASQGSLPSTLWGASALERMRDGQSAKDTVGALTRADAGRDQRQMSALDPQGRTAHFTGAASLAVAGARQAPNVVVAGNLLACAQVLDACLSAYLAAEGAFDQRLMAAMDAAAQMGGDSRGFLSAALLVVRWDAAPLSLRIDHSPTPLADLRALHSRATSGAYADWAQMVPTLAAPYRSDPPKDTSGRID